MTHFVRHHTSVEAIHFDGSRESARAVAAMLPFKVARHIEQDDVLMVTNGYDMTEVVAGDWVAVELLGGVRVWKDDHFRALHTGFNRSSEKA